MEINIGTRVVRITTVNHESHLLSNLTTLTRELGVYIRSHNVLHTVCMTTEPDC